MTNFTQNEIQILDSLCTCTEILAAIQDLTGTRFVEDGKINEYSTAFRVWLDPSFDGWCPGWAPEAEDIMERAWELADNYTDQLCWGESTFYRR